MRTSPPTSRSNSITILTAHMAHVQTDHRKQMFATVTGAWPTPPQELELDFHPDTSEHGDQQETKGNMNMLALKQEAQEKLILSAMHSPPTSPESRTWSDRLPPIHSPQEEHTSTTLPGIADRELFSEPSINSSLPLFPKTDDRIDSLSPVPDKPVNKSLYIMFPQFRNMETEDLKRYVDECYQELKRMPGFRPVNPPSTHQRSFAYSPPRPARITKPKPIHVHVQPSKMRVPKIMTARDAASPITPVRSVKTPARVRERNSVSVEPQARKRAAPSKVVAYEDWQTLPDYSPPACTLDTQSQRLKVHWKGAPNDLSHDPEINHLHPQEVEIAQELKLPAGQYLSNKRRIFEARLKSIRERKNFTKTAAQQACNIDVNKTSQLYEAYERVGWFDEAVFAKWLS